MPLWFLSVGIKIKMCPPNPDLLCLFIFPIYIQSFIYNTVKYLNLFWDIYLYFAFTK